MSVVIECDKGVDVISSMKSWYYEGKVTAWEYCQIGESWLWICPPIAGVGDAQMRDYFQVYAQDASEIKLAYVFFSHKVTDVPQKRYLAACQQFVRSFECLLNEENAKIHYSEQPEDEVDRVVDAPEEEVVIY